jgi:hypothetical protein
MSDAHRIAALERENAMLATDLDLMTEKFKQAVRAEQTAKNRLNGQRAHEPRAADIQNVIDHWRLICDHPRAKAPAGSDRWDAVRKMLLAEFSTADLKQACNGAARVPYVVNSRRSGTGARKQRYDDLTLICRDVRKVEQFMDLALDEDGELVPPAPNEPVVGARLLDEAIDEAAKYRRTAELLKEMVQMQDSYILRLEAELGLAVAA